MSRGHVKSQKVTRSLETSSSSSSIPPRLCDRQLMRPCQRGRVSGDEQEGRQWDGCTFDSGAGFQTPTSSLELGRGTSVGSPDDDVTAPELAITNLARRRPLCRGGTKDFQKTILLSAGKKENARYLGVLIPRPPCLKKSPRLGESSLRFPDVWAMSS